MFAVLTYNGPGDWPEVVEIYDDRLEAEEEAISRSRREPSGEWWAEWLPPARLIGAKLVPY